MIGKEQEKEKKSAQHMKFTPMQLFPLPYEV
jgi:hypothetical protein